MTDIDYEIGFVRGGFDRPAQAFVHQKRMPDQVAQFAMRLLQAPGLLTIGDPDGEDSAGRAKARERSVPDVVGRCFDIAQAAYAVAEERGLLIELPGLQETRERARDESDRN